MKRTIIAAILIILTAAGIQAQNKKFDTITVKGIKYVALPDSSTSDTALVFENGRIYYKVITGGGPTDSAEWADTAGYALASPGGASLMDTTGTTIHPNSSLWNLCTGSIDAKGNKLMVATGRVLFGTDTAGAGTKFMYIPNKAGALRYGTAVGTKYDYANIGNGSLAGGNDCQASGENSIAIGGNSNATGASSVALINASATGGYDLAVGYSAATTGAGDVAIGPFATATGSYGQALGYKSKASAFGATAIGDSARATGIRSVAIGRSLASGMNSLAFGDLCVSGDARSITMGYNCNIQAAYGPPYDWTSAAIGYNLTVYGIGCFAGGKGNTISLGYAPIQGASILGINNSTTKDYSFTAGGSNTGNSSAGAIFGLSNYASAPYVLLTGTLDTASGYGSVVTGSGSKANDSLGVAMGLRAKANHKYSAVFGKDIVTYRNYTLHAAQILARDTLIVGTGTGSYIKEDTTNAIRLHGNTTVWNTIWAPATAMERLLQDGTPAFDTTYIAYLFPQNDSAQAMGYVFQIPEGYKEGSTIYPRIHYISATAERPFFRMKYKWINGCGSMPADWTYITQDASCGGGDLNDHLTFPGIDGTGMEAHSNLIVIIYRIGGDDYAMDCAVIGVDVHYETDAMGANTQTSKD